MKLPVPKNWGLHLLALILAIVIYHVLKQESTDSFSANDRPIFQYR